MAEQFMSPAAGNSGRSQRRRIPTQQMKALFRSAAIGDVVSILMQAPKHKMMTLDALRWSIMPAVFHNQFLIARIRKEGASGSGAGGVAFWANVSDDADKRLRAAPEQEISLSLGEWNSGPHLWLIDLVAPPSLTPSMLADLDARIAKGRMMTTKIVEADGRVRITTVKDLIAAAKATTA